MADLIQNVVIDFVIKDESLAPAIDKLQQLGIIDAKVANSFKQTTAELNKQINTVKNVAGATAPVKKNLEDISKATKQVSKDFMIGFQEGIIDTLQDAGVSLEQFEQAMSDTGSKVATGVKSVRTELLEMREAIIRAKTNGEDYGESYDALVLKAGKLKDAISDVNLELNNAGSDTRVLDNLVGTATAAAGAFSAVQGAAALFGDESEELQEVLLKVNAAMAIAQGLQAVSNALQKEGAVTLLAMNIQRKQQAALLVVENALQSRNVIVKAAATVAQKALNAAMAVNPVGLLVIGITALILALKTFASTAETATNALIKLNSEFDRDLDALNDYADTVKRNGDELLAAMEARGVKSAELRKQTTQNLQEELRATIETETQYRDQYRQTVALLTDVANGRRELNDDEVEQARAFVKNFEALSKRRVDLASRTRIQISNNEAALLEEQKEAAKKATEAAEKAAEERRAARERQLKDEIAAIERQLLAVENGTNDELQLQKKLIVAKANLELNAEKLTQNQVKLIQEQSFKDRQNLQKEFNDKLRADAIAAQISRNNAELEQLKINNDDRLLLQISNLELAAQAEIDAAGSNSAKIKEIIAKRDADIRDTKIKFIQETVDYENALFSAQGGVNKRALEQIVSNEKLKKDLRINAVNEIARIEVSGIERQMAALEKQKQNKLISEKDYQLKYAQLQDQKIKVTTDAEGKITGIIETEEEKRKRIQGQAIDLVLQSANQTIDVLDKLFNLQSDRERIRLSEDKERLEEKRKAGVITEKEYIASQKRIDAEERKMRIQQLQRDKQIALFQAIINTAASVVKASPVVPLMIFAAAAGAAQIALIASQPIPRFKKGKKKGDSYEGLGYVGEAGTELIERGGKLFIASKPTITYLGPKDVVYTPQQTKAMMSATHKVDKTVMSFKETVKTPPINYDEMAKAIGKHVKGPSININKDFISESIKDGLSIINHHSKYYSYPK